MIRPSTKSLLIRFPHGLGDCVQFLGVLDQLRETRPDVDIDVQVKPGFEGLFTGHCRRTFACSAPWAYDQVVKLHWPEPQRCYPGMPGTKATRTLLEIFGIAPKVVRPWLPDAVSFSRKWPRSVVLHYQGNSSREKKDIPEKAVERLVEFLTRHNVALEVVDTQRKSKLANGPLLEHVRPVVGVMPRVIGQADLFIGIDSGPAKLAQLTDTPSIVVWTGMHPYHFAEPVGPVTHLVPSDHARLLRGDDITPGMEYFEANYKYATYGAGSLAGVLIGQAAETLGLEPPASWAGLTATSYGEQYYAEHKAAGLDYLSYGDWQRDYARWLTEALDLTSHVGGMPTVLDLGCACGSVAQGFLEAGCEVYGTDLNNHMVGLGRNAFPGVRLDVCDAVNLHLFSDKHFDFIHTAQVFEHLRPELVPYILSELYRVLKPGGLLFTAHDTLELYARQGRHIETEDPTHLCLWPRLLWDLAFEDAGFVDVSEEAGVALQGHPRSYFGRYDWDWWVLRRPA